jgi:hypothetical protein
MNYLVVSGLIVFSMIVFAVIANTAVIYAQQAPTNTTQVVVPTSTSSTTKLHLVKITSPAKGQQVPTGKDLTVSGIAGTAVAATASAAARAIDGNTTSNCQVFIIANGVKPYQLATATGPGGATDYSKWNFTLSSNYTEIKQGPGNKITAKYACNSTPATLSFYSVNVTGVGSAGLQNNSVVTNDSASGGNIGHISKLDNHGSNDGSIQHSPAATDPNTNKRESSPDGQASDEIKGEIKNIPSVNPTLHGKINELKNALKDNIKKQIERTPGP